MAASQLGVVVTDAPAHAARPYSAADRYRSRQKLRQPQRRGVRWAAATAATLMFVFLCWYVWFWPADTGRDEVSGEQGIPAAVSVDVANVTPAVADKPSGDREQDRALNRLLSDLTSQDAQVCQQAISGLLQFPVPDSRRSEVTNHVEKVLESGNPTTRQKVLPLLARWHAKKTVKVLVKVIENSRDREMRKTGIRALGSIGSSESCTALAALMDGAPTQELASLGRALRVAGSLAEEVVGQLLQHTRETVRIEACDVLRQIGGTRSIRRLSDVAQQDTSSNVRKAASHAMERIKNASGR